MEPLRFERFEFKYFLPEFWSGDLRAFLFPYVRPDAHTEGAGDGRYSITNLYFDTRTLAFYRAHRNQEIDRFKLRIRAYTAEDAGPVYLEVKRKVKQVVLKTRVPVERDRLEGLLAGDNEANLTGADARNLEEFLSRMVGHGARPVMLVRYEREAYESLFGEYARVTLDRAMCYQPAQGLDLEGDPGEWRYFDSHATMAGLSSAFLLEVKFTRIFPAWMVGLIRTFNLQRHEFSKYLSAVGHLRETTGAFLAPSERPVVRV